MTDTNKTKSKKGKKKEEVEEEEDGEETTQKNQLMFMGQGNIDNFDNEDEGYVEKVREPNTIHLRFQQRTTRKCLTII